MGAMVKRDRNHPSIIIWSFCNEAGCEGSQEQGGPAFREIAYHFDGSRELPRYRWHLGCILLKMPQRYLAGRPRAGQHVHVQRPALVRAACQSRLFSPDNHHHAGCSHRRCCVFSDTIDVQGFSHQNRAKIDSCHKAMPDKPIFESECCSCNTMRGENTGIESSDGGSNAVRSPRL